MNEITPTTDAVHQTLLRKISRLRTLTIVSLSLNGLILLLLLLACVVHHHRMKHHHHGGMENRQMGMRGQGWGGPRDFRGGRFGGERGDFDRGRGERGGSDRQGGFGRQDRNDGQMGGPGGGEKRPPATPEEMSTKMLDHLSQKLTLTDDEKTKIKPILLDQATQMQKDREAQKQAMMKSMDDTKAKIRALLTPDQQKQLDEAKMGPEKDKGAATPPAPPLPAK